MSTQKTITIDTIKQLIDINGDATNFKANFTVSAPNGDSFFMLVADQNKLDSGEELQYRQVQGSESGSIVADKNVYQNYYLVLKADRPIPVDVAIDFEPLPMQDLPYQPKQFNPPESAQVPQTRPQAPTTQVPQRGPQLPQGPSAGKPNDDRTGIAPYWKWILVAAVVVVGGYFLYKFYRESQKNKGDKVGSPPGSSPGKSASPPVKSPSPAPKNPAAMNPPGKFTFGRVPATGKYY